MAPGRERERESARAAPRRALVEARDTNRVNGSRRCRKGDEGRERKREREAPRHVYVYGRSHVCEGVEYGRVYLASRE